MRHFGIAPAAPLALLTIFVEIGASVLILAGIRPRAGALVLAGFALSATYVANGFWETAQPERFMAANALFEHLGLRISPRGLARPAAAWQPRTRTGR